MRKAATEARRTVVELDLVGYSHAARTLEGHIGPTVLFDLNDQVQGFVDEGLREVGLLRKDVVNGTAGDNALLAFERASDAHRFSEAVHHATTKHNAKRADTTTHRHFRIGVTTGVIGIRGKEISGTRIIDSVRLEAAGKPGHILIDEATYDELPRKFQDCYRGPESVFDKQNNSYKAYRCIVVESQEVGTAAPAAKPTDAAKPMQDVSRLTHSAEKLIGRETELTRLNEAWQDATQHVLIIKGIGGEGKTSLVGAWANELSRRDYDGATYFDWSFYSQGTRDQTSATSEPFLAAALEFFGGDEGKALANSPIDARDKASRLLGYLRAQRALLVLDGLEPLQYPPGPLAGQLRDDAMAILLKGLAQSSPGLCVVTTRESVTDLEKFQESTAPEWELEKLSDAAGAALLQRLLEPPKPKHIHQVKSTVAEREEICRAVKGHALTLRLLGGFIHRALRDVRRWREVDYADADAQYKTNPKKADARYGHAFTTIEAYEQWFASGGAIGARQLAVLRLLGLFDRPARGDLIAALRNPPVISSLTDALVGLPDTEWNTTLSALEECGLVTLPHAAFGIPHSIDAHPLLREYFARRVREQQPEAWRAAHRRLYEHLCAATKEGDQPTLEDLQPLYQAVAHGCQAGLQQEAHDNVHFKRIRRGNEYYSSGKLGAFGSDLGAIACFFEPPWSCPSTQINDSDRAVLFAQAAFNLRALGRLTESLEPMRTALKNNVTRENWEHAAINAINLSELELTLGEVAEAVGDAKLSVTYADRSGDAFWKMGTRTTHADALHQAGRRAEAEARFREAEQIQAERQPDYTLMYSLQGFQYCDLLLTEAERAAWRDEGGGRRDELIAACRAVSERAAQTLQWAEQNKAALLSIALDHLTLGRAALYAAILSNSALRTPHSELDSAVSGLRRAGTTHHIPLGLLTRAWLRVLENDHDGAREDLDEAWEIAERGPMPLFMADIHLYRARLFGRLKDVSYPWESVEADLAAAEKLITECGYHRRDEELADAKAALLKR